MKNTKQTYALIKVTTFVVILIYASSLHYAQVNFSRAFQGDIVNDSGISASVCLGDYDNDGFIDVFIANWANQNNFLYNNNGDGSFTKIIDGEIVNDRGFSSGPCWGDYNNDGYLDLFVANQQNQNNFLYKNNGDGSFTKITKGDIVNDYGDSYSSAWVDYNNDGYLDLFVGNSSQNNFLYKNNGNENFTRIKEGAIVNDGGISFGASWGDYNNDGYQDLFVANKNEENNFLYKNNGDGTFSKIISGDIVNDGGNSNGGNWGDYDNDGDLDLFVANGPFFFNGQNNFLYNNNGDGTFTKISNDPVVSDLAKSMNGNWGDFDNDGDLDLFVSTYVHNDLLYLNNGDGSFVKVEEGLIVNLAGFSASSAVADFNNDGYLDLFLPNWENQNNIIYMNNTTGLNWIKIKCQGIKSNKAGIGVKIKLLYKINKRNVIQYREIITNSGFRSQGGNTVHFGLGDVTEIESLEIIWTSGETENLNKIKSNQTLTISEGSGIIDQHSPLIIPRRLSIFRVVNQQINEKGIEAAVRLYHSLKEDKFDEYDFSEPQLNYLGYTLLQSGKFNEAIVIFKLNLESFPSSANVYDSIAEAYIKIGDNKLAIEYTKKMLEVIKSDANINDDFREVLINGAKYRLKNYE